MIADIVTSVLVKGILALIGIGLLVGGVSAVGDGSEFLGSIMGLLGLVILLGLKFKAF